MSLLPAVPRALFYPKSVAIIGASTEDGSVGNEITRNVIKQGYHGQIFLINPKGGNLFGRKVLTSLELVKEPIDLAIIAGCRFPLCHSFDHRESWFPFVYVVATKATFGRISGCCP